ncbi:MAG: enterotoxin [Verrucomicrobiota bacterium]|jgi:hypothetical protein
MNGFLLCVLVPCALWSARAEGPGQSLENANLAWHWRLADGKIQPLRVEDKLHGGSLTLDGECFAVLLGDGTTVNSSDFTLVGQPVTENLKPDLDSPVAGRHYGGRQLVARYAGARQHLTAEWRVILRDGATYLRPQLTLRAAGGDVVVKEIVLFDQRVPGAQVAGTVDGSPVVAGNFFIGYEHPMAQNTVAAGAVRCALRRNAVLRDGESLVQGCVLGVSPAGQMRRGFLAYLERERAHPYRPFLHYNSWFDIAWDKRKFNEAESLDAINTFGKELVQKRGVQMQSFLFDDGWDDNRTLWNFHSGFPNGFDGVKLAAAKLNASVGVWLSPFGGYNEARELRLQYGVQQGFETNASGFSLAGPRYFQRFHDICLNMVSQYGVNMFKFDGLAAGARASETGQTRDGDAMLRLVADLRAAKPDIYINETTGTWPSPFWLLYVDSTWRGGADHDFSGKGAPRQQWITYRDAQTYANVVRRGPLYPLNSLMLHGIVFAKNAGKLETADDAEFADEVQSFFASGTQLQELYLTPKLLDRQNWDDLSEGARWSRANADVLVDTHWIGGDPGSGQVYGWASWSPAKAVLALRNPDDQLATFALDAQTIFQLPDGVNKSIRLVRVMANGKAAATTQLQPGKTRVFTLQPFEVSVWESEPDANLSNASAGGAAMLERPN